MERQQVILSIWDNDCHSASEGDDMFIPLALFREKVGAGIENLTPELAASARIRIRCHGDYASAYLEVECVREETDAEVAARKAMDEKYRADYEERERQQFLRLKARFEP